MDFNPRLLNKVTLETDIDRLLDWGILDGRTRNSLAQAGVTLVKDMLCYDADSLRNVPYAGKKTIKSLKMAQFVLSHLSFENDEQRAMRDWEYESIDAFPFSRSDLSFLNEEQFSWVVEHWETYDIVPSSYILYHYLISSEVRNDIIRKIFFGLDKEHHTTSLAEIAKQFDLSRERIRQIVMKPTRFPNHLGLCRKILQGYFPKKFFCFDIAEITYILDREQLQLTPSQYADFLCCCFNYVAKVSVVPNGKLYLVRRQMTEGFPIEQSLNVIDKNFLKYPSINSDTPLEDVVQMTRNRAYFVELAPIFQEYIKAKYGLELTSNIIPVNKETIQAEKPTVEVDKAPLPDYKQVVKKPTKPQKGRKILEITDAQGEVWIDEYAYITFVKFIEYVGAERILPLNLEAKPGFPLITKEILEKSSSKPTKDGWYVYTGMGNNVKADLVNHISEHFNLGFSAVSYLAEEKLNNA